MPIDFRPDVRVTNSEGCGPYSPKSDDESRRPTEPRSTRKFKGPKQRPIAEERSLSFVERLARLLPIARLVAADCARRRSGHSTCRCRAVLAAATALMVLASVGSVQAEGGSLLIELNKLESQDKGCRAYVVVTNKNSKAYQILKLDLIVFQPDGVIGRRFAIDLGPIKSDKRVVKLFDIDNAPCDQIGSFLINDVLECKVEENEQSDCLADITASSITKTQLTK
jgi:hypothetical protein